jgi:hypothetical protein
MERLVATTSEGYNEQQSYEGFPSMFPLKFSGITFSTNPEDVPSQEYHWCSVPTVSRRLLWIALTAPRAT